MKAVVLDGKTLNPGDNPWHPVRDALGDGCDFIVYDHTEESQITERAQGAQVVLTNKAYLSTETIQALPELQLICVLATGVNSVDLEGAANRNVTVCNVPEYGTQSVAQFVMAQMLHHVHRLSFHDDRIREGAWQKSGSFSFWETPQIELADLNFGIIGFGRIGQAVARLASAFQMNVLVHTRNSQGIPSSYKAVSLPEVLQLSDVLSLHCVLTKETRGIINEAALAQMKSTALLINSARGSLIDEDALVNALKAGQLAGASLDVVPEEPIPGDSALLHAPNLLLTPHMAWASLKARKRLMQTTADNISGFLRRAPQNTVR